jgi:hypothetical protein
MFKITGNKGFHMTFKNGITISVQFGPGNYCEHHWDDTELPYQNMQSKDAEIALWDRVGNWVTKEYKPDAGDDVLGGQSPDEVAKAILWAQSHS